MAPTNPANSIQNGSRSRTSSRSRRRTDCLSLTFSSHPLFQLRRGIIIAAVTGAILLFSASSWYPYYGGPMHSNFIVLGMAAFLCALDLICWASRKKDNPDEDPNRPTGKWAIVDLTMAALLQFIFWTSLFELNDTIRYGYSINILSLYGILADLVCSVFHAWCFWNQLMSHKKQNWLSTLEQQPCARCGYTEEQNNPPTSDHRHDDEHANTFPYAGPSANFGRASVLTPESPESAMEEGLLIGSDFGSDYGSVKRTEPVLEPPEQVVVGKGKKKVKSGTSQKGSVGGSTS